MQWEFEDILFWTAAILVAVVAAAALAGCATVRTSAAESTVDADGASYEFRYSAMSTAAPFGKVDATAHTLSYDVTEDGLSALRVGADAQGIDNTGQVAAIQAVTQALIQAFASGLLAPGGAVPQVSGSGSGSIAQRIDGVLSEVQSIRERLLDLGILPGEAAH
jgi:hypothetical protein